jgi:hypothetical protein
LHPGSIPGEASKNQKIQTRRNGREFLRHRFAGMPARSPTPDRLRPVSDGGAAAPRSGTPQRETGLREQKKRRYRMDIHIPLSHPQPIASIVAGVLILAMPQKLNWILAAYLILIGVLGLGLFH